MKNNFEMTGSVPAEEQIESKELENNLRYETEAGPVDLEWKEFAPEANNGQTAENSNEAIIYLPGAALSASSRSVEELTGEYAKYGNAPAYSVSTRIENPNIPESQLPQAEAIKQFIAQKGLQGKKLTIVGNSQGGNKAIDLTYLLQQDDKKIDINGLVLIGSGGLYEQDPKRMLINFFKDAQMNTPPDVIKTALTNPKKSFIRRSLQIGYDVGKGIAKEGFRAPRELPRRMMSEAEDASHRNERAEKLKVPIVLVQGTMDPVSNYKELIPAGSEDQSLASQEKRGEEVKKNLFKQSKNVKVLLAERGGHHGVQYFRPDAMAKTTLYMLERMGRNKRTENE